MSWALILMFKNEAGPTQPQKLVYEVRMTQDRISKKQHILQSMWDA